MASVNSADDDKEETIDGQVVAVNPVTATAGSEPLEKSGEMLAVFDEEHDSAVSAGCPSLCFSPRACRTYSNNTKQRNFEYMQYICQAKTQKIHCYFSIIWPKFF